MHEHLALIKSEAINMLTGKYAEGITIFGQIENQALVMADVMTHGIIYSSDSPTPFWYK